MALEGELEDYPIVHAAYLSYVDVVKTDPTNAQQLVQWCKRQGIREVKYAKVNKYMRIRRKLYGARKTIKKPAVKASYESSFVRSKAPSSGLVRAHSQRIVASLEDSSRDRASSDFTFDKGQTKAQKFSDFTMRFEKKMADDSAKASKTHTAWKKVKAATPRRIHPDKLLGIDSALLAELESCLDDAPVSRSTTLEEPKDHSFWGESESLGTDSSFDDVKAPADAVVDEDADESKEPPIKPWLRMKPYWKQGDANMASAEESKALKAFLKKLKMKQFFEQMSEVGVHSLADLKVLETEDEVKELVGPHCLNLGVVFRRKFIKAVMKLDRSEMKKPPVSAPKKASPTPAEERPSPSPEPVVTAKGATTKEQKALNMLTASIKVHTLELRKAREELSSVQRQVGDTSKMLDDLYKKALGIMTVRKQQLEKALALADKDTSAKLKKRVSELQTSAKQLLLCKRSVEQKFRTAAKSEERTTTVVESVTSALEDAPVREPGRLRIIFDTGDDDLLEILENFGTIGVGKTVAD